MAANINLNAKLNTYREKIDNFRPIIAIIPCRKQFDFSTDVWKRKIQGKTLLKRNIEKC